MDTLGKRLRVAVKRWGSIRRFQRAMAEAEARGHSNQMIYDYLMDRRGPSLEFIKEAAKILDIREAWLVSGEGPMTDLEATVAGGISAPRDRLGREGFDFFEAEARRFGVTEAVNSLFADTVLQLLATATQQEDIDQEMVSAVAGDLHWMLNLPRHLWGFGSGSDARTMNDFYLASLLALRLVIANPMSHPVDDYKDSLIHSLREIFDPQKDFEDAWRSRTRSPEE